MNALIPVFILNRFREGIFQGDFSAYTVFIDISGFTKMSQDLMRYDKDGSETLCFIINKVFSSAIESVHKNGGFISTFAGDAFTAIFEKEVSNLSSAIKACIEIREKINDTGTIETRFGTFSISVKMGLSEGSVNWRILKTAGNSSYFFRGEGIDNAACAEHQAGRNEIIIDKGLLDRLKRIDDKIKYRQINKDYIRFLSIDNIGDETFPVCRGDISIEKEFVSPSVLSLKERGEFREILSLFLTFQEKGNFIKGITEAIDLSRVYGAYLKQIDFGDKGGTLLFFFGAPRAMERPFERAVDFALQCIRIKNLECKMALTFGRAFAGFIGSSSRSEYGALGNVVNKSARLAMTAEWNSILADEIVYNKTRDKYIFNFMGSGSFKGFDEEIKYYAIIKKRVIYEEKEYKGRMFAREKELALLQEKIHALQGNKFGGLVYINGDPGTGKTRLLWELRNNIDEKGFFWAYMPCDSILKNSFNPVKYFLREFFNYSDEHDNDVNKGRFETILNEIIQSIEDPYIEEELERTKSIFAYLLGIDYLESLYDQLNPKNRYENTINAIKTLFRALSIIKPLIIELDDGQWIDNETLDFLSKLVINIDDIPFLIMSECRYKDDGERIDYKLDSIKNKTFHIDLKYFDKKTTRSFILDFFKIRSISITTLDYVYNYTSGNPFFLEQILAFIKENNILDKDHNILTDKMKIPSDINSLIIARIDRLSDDLKEIIKTASVLGIEFPLKILDNMFSGISILEKVRDLEKEQIWFPFTQLSYMFKHILIRESVYGIQLKETLIKLHSLAAETIKSFYGDKLEMYYPDLANHYEQAENIEELKKYLKLSILYYEKNYHNKKAIEYYEKLYGYTHDLRDQLHIKHKIMSLFGKVGKIKEAIEIGKWTLQCAEENNLNDMIIMSTFHLGIAYNAAYDLENALKAFEYIIKDPEKYKNRSDKEILAGSYREMGKNYHHRGYDEKALTYFQKALRIYEQIENKPGKANCYNDIGIFCGRQIGLDKVLEYLFKSYEIFKGMGDLGLQLIPLCNIGLTYYEVYLDFNRSNYYYEKALDLASKIGSYRDMMVLYLNLGNNYSFLGDREKEYMSLKSAIKFGNEMQDIDFLSLCYSAMAELFHRKKENKKALFYIDKAIDMIKGKKYMNLRLIDHKFLKTALLISMKQYEKALKELREIKKLNKHYNIKSLNEQIQIFEYHIKYLLEYKTALKNLQKLAKTGLCKENEALAYYTLWKLSEKDEYRVKALSLYKELVDDLSENYKNYNYILKVKELEN